MREKGAPPPPLTCQRVDTQMIKQYLVYDHFHVHLPHVSSELLPLHHLLYSPSVTVKKSLVQCITSCCSIWGAGRKDLLHCMCNLRQHPWAVGDSPEEEELKQLLSSKADWHGQSNKKVNGGAGIPLAVSTVTLDKKHCLTFFWHVFLSLRLLSHTLELIIGMLWPPRTSLTSLSPFPVHKPWRWTKAAERQFEFETGATTKTCSCQKEKL